MMMMWVAVHLVICVGFAEESSRQDINIGAIFSFGSINGKVAKIAMAAAAHDVNSDPTILPGFNIVLSMHDSNYSGFLGIIGGLQYLEADTVAIIGPQSSGMARVLSQLANEVHVPMLSFTALDPILSSLQYPFFIQTAPNDLFLMAALVDTITHYAYREVVVVYPDDEQSRGTITALSEKLTQRRCRINYRALLSPESLATTDEIMNQLAQISLMESRVIIVHAYAAIGLEIFDVAYRLGMMEKGYVWIATTWLSTVLDSTVVSWRTARSIQGVITFRPHTPDSERKTAFLSRWEKLSEGLIGWNPYASYAYDTVWLIAKAVSVFVKRGGAFSFSNGTIWNRSVVDGEGVKLGSLSRFEGGKLLLKCLLESNMSGLTGRIAFDGDKLVIGPSFEILNVVGRGYKRVGYWSNNSGLSVWPPEMKEDKWEQLRAVVWPGRTTVKPRGWVFPHNGRRLRVGIPDRVSYKAFVSKDENTNEIRGFCIDVFVAAINLLPYLVPYEFVLFGDKRGVNPSYNDLTNMIVSEAFDAVAGDVAIVRNRTKVVDFTQPYTESGLVVVAPLRKMNSRPWAFMRPFTLSMWGVTGAFFLIIGVVVWILEHKQNDDFRGPPRKQLITILWFGFSTMFFAHRENTVSTLGRMVIIIWLYLVLIITSSYTASLTSILTVEQLAPSIKGIESLMTTKDRIGFQVGSFAENYLTEELNIAKSRLLPLGSPEEIADALNRGTVAAVVDERPYVDEFLSRYCMFQVVGREFTTSGWGFAFRRDSQLVMDMSTAILTLSENGELQNIHNKWLKTKTCSVQSNLVNWEQLQLKSFWGLFLICGVACLLALLYYFASIMLKFSRHQQSGSSSPSPRFQKFLSFMDMKEEPKPRTKWKRKNLERHRHGNNE